MLENLVHKFVGEYTRLRRDLDAHAAEADGDAAAQDNYDAVCDSFSRELAALVNGFTAALAIA